MAHCSVMLTYFVYKPHTTHDSLIRSDEGLTPGPSAFDSLYGGQYTLSTQLIKPNYLVILPTNAAPQFLEKPTRPSMWGKLFAQYTKYVSLFLDLLTTHFVTSQKQQNISHTKKTSPERSTRSLICISRDSGHLFVKSVRQSHLRG